MLIVETALVIALATSSRQREFTSERQTDVVSVAASKLATVFPSVTVTHQVDFAGFVAADFGTVKGVSGVEVTMLSAQRFAVATHLSIFERAVRRRVYAKQQALSREFPMYSFDFLLIDGSDAHERATSN